MIKRFDGKVIANSVFFLFFFLSKTFCLHFHFLLPVSRKLNIHNIFEKKNQRCIYSFDFIHFSIFRLFLVSKSFLCRLSLFRICFFSGILRNCREQRPCYFFNSQALTKSEKNSSTELKLSSLVCL